MPYSVTNHNTSCYYLHFIDEKTVSRGFKVIYIYIYTHKQSQNLNPSLPDSKPWFCHIPRSLMLQEQDLFASEKSGGSESKAPFILRLVFYLKIPMNSVCFLTTKLTFKKLLLSWFELITIRKGLHMCNLVSASL